MSDKTPNQKEIMEAIDDASKLRDEIIEYRNKAQEIDDNFIERHDEDAQEIHLDILPYGEELVRTSNLPDDLEKSTKNLNIILNNGIADPKENNVIYERALECIEDAKTTLEDCTDISENDDEEEEDY